MHERTLVILKPEAVSAKKIARILGTFEDAGLDIERLEMRTASEALLTEHYPSDDEWFGIVGQKTLDTYEQYGGDPVKVIGTSDAVEIGRIVKAWLVQHMASGKIVVAVVAGNHAIDAVRKLVGATIPLNADPGSIRGSLSTDSPDLANEEMRPVRNLIHASGDPAEAAREIALWFSQDD